LFRATAAISDPVWAVEAPRQSSQHSRVNCVFWARFDAHLVCRSIEQDLIIHQERPRSDQICSPVKIAVVDSVRGDRGSDQLGGLGVFVSKRQRLRLVKKDIFFVGRGENRAIYQIVLGGFCGDRMTTATVQLPPGRACRSFLVEIIESQARVLHFFTGREAALRPGHCTIGR